MGTAVFPHSDRKARRVRPSLDISTQILESESWPVRQPLGAINKILAESPLHDCVVGYASRAFLCFYIGVSTHVVHGNNDCMCSTFFD